MTENIENLMLEHLKAIRAQLDRIERDIHDLKARMERRLELRDAQ